MTLHRIALVTATCTFFLLMLGGFVHSSGSSLACPDWPLCYGQLFPRMEGGVLFEHSHRLLGATVGALTLVMAILAWRGENRTTRRFGVAALALVVFQGVLGGITVLYRLPMAISTSHLATSMVFFGVIVTIALRTRPGDARARVTSATRATSPWFAAAGIAVYVQLVLGALVRHTGSALACGTDPLLCNGVLFPPWGPAALQMLHRLLAYVVAVLVVTAAVRLLRAARGARLGFLPRMAIGSLVVVAAQIGLGMVTVMTPTSPYIVTLHVGGGALLLACVLSMWVTLRLGTTQSLERASDRPVALSATPARATS